MSDQSNPFSFPFPGQKPAVADEAKVSPPVNLPPFPEASKKQPDLPPLPEGPQPFAPSDKEFSEEEQRQIRKFLALFGENWLDSVDKQTITPEKPPDNPPVTPFSLEEPWAKLMNSCHDGSERELAQFMAKIGSGFATQKEQLDMLLRSSSLLPAQEQLRHSSPDQKQACLTFLTDRFLSAVSGWNFPERRQLLVKVAAWASQLSGAYSYLHNEGEPFDNQYYERSPESDSVGQTIRQIQAFVVMRNDTRQVIRLGRALT